MGKFVVGISGGVDSSVAAYLLLKAGHEVVGCRMRTYDTDASKIEEESAEVICRTLGIPLITPDFRDVFMHEVIEYFANEYREGRTPNPCCICNRRVKWNMLMKNLEETGADYVATGHYAESVFENGRYAIKRVPNEKDQSYALYNLTQDEIRLTRFPLVGYSKDEIRKMAAEAGLPTANKADSMDVCFIPDGDYAGFLKEKAGIEDKPGNFVDIDGNILGPHRGITNFTVGQRKGLGIALGKRVFVKEIRPLTGEVVLADDCDVFTDGILIKDVNFQLVESDTIESPCIRIRYADKGAPGIMKREDDETFRLSFERPVRAAAPGQAAVLYDNEGRILCGGTIV
ncbi:MAG: tRNA 2-thiouridine(34) synthase MnmA [Eubacteriales bacterium]|nr:tRNA 2-thiouridine(34) synthase MnmA [Eubacteriales bacterium]